MQLKPLQMLPRKATLLNTGKPVQCSVEVLPVDHSEQKAYLSIRKLPINELANTVMVVKLEFAGDWARSVGAESGEATSLFVR